MDYTLEKMESIPLIGLERMFDFENSYQEIPKFWSEFSAACTSGQYPADVHQAIESSQMGEFAVCIDDDHACGRFRYLIAGRYQGGAVPEGMKVFTIPGGLWAKFRCYGPMPGALQAVNTKIFKEWLPGNPDYEIADGINIEWYSMGDMQSPEYESGIWLPVKKK